MADSPTERRPRTPLPRGQEPGKPPARRPGAPTPTGGRMPRLPGGRTFWIVVLALLAVNYLSVALFAPGRAQSVTIPYDQTSPSGFKQQVEAGNVSKIKTQGASIEGEFKKEVRFPNDKADA